MMRRRPATTGHLGDFPPAPRPDMPSGSALLRPRPYRDVNARASGFMTLYQALWNFERKPDLGTH